MAQTNRFVVAETFGVKAPRGLTVEGFTDPLHPQIPVKKPYVFREHLRDVLAFLADPAGDGLLHSKLSHGEVINIDMLPH